MAKELYGKSAVEEVAALTFLSADKPRTLGITAVSAAALWYHAGQLHEAERAAHHAMTLPGLPRFAVSQLRTLLQSIWNESAQQAAGLALFVQNLVRDKTMADEKAPYWLRTGQQFWAVRRGTQARLLWTVVEPSMGKPGWLCRSGNQTEHSDDLTSFERP